MKVTYKKYYCPLCGAESEQQTNHFGEIYVICKHCGKGILYCKEPEAIAYMENRKQEKVVFHAYRFSLDNETEKKEYIELCKHLNHYFGYRMYDAVTLGNMHTQSVEHRKHDQQVITLYDVDQWKDQFVSSIGRLHNWFEFVFPNRKVKAGYWLERIEE